MSRSREPAEPAVTEAAVARRWHLTFNEPVETCLSIPGAAPAPTGSIDAGVPWHYGDPHAEQRALESGRGAVDLSHRDVLRITGADRLGWLHSLTTAALDRLAPGDSALALILSPHGHVEHELHVIEDGTATWITVEPGEGSRLAAYLRSMQFMLRVEVAELREEFGVVWEPVRLPDLHVPTWLVPLEYAGQGSTAAGIDRGGDASRYVGHRPAHLVGREVVLPRSQVRQRVLDSGAPAGTWALEALRIAAAVPRLGLETDHRTLPHEVGWVGPAVHLAKGCYRGQEAVARVHNLGQPPRRLVLLHLDGSHEVLPAHGDVVLLGEREVGWIGSSARHHEWGPIATAIVKRSVDRVADLIVSAQGEHVAAGQEAVTLAP